MTEVLQPQVLSQARRLQESTKNLARSLDDHLERYLNLLSEYQKLQQDLNKHLSNVYLASTHQSRQCFDSANRAISHLRKPTSPIQTGFATAKTTTTTV